MSYYCFLFFLLTRCLEDLRPAVPKMLPQQILIIVHFLGFCYCVASNVFGIIPFSCKMRLCETRPTQLTVHLSDERGSAFNSLYFTPKYPFKNYQLHQGDMLLDNKTRKTRRNIHIWRNCIQRRPHDGPGSGPVLLYASWLDLVCLH